MELLYLNICDYAFLSIDHKVNVIGMFETINSHEYPVNHYKIALVGSILPSKDQFKMAVDIVNVKTGISVMREVQTRDVNLPADRHSQNFNFIIEIINTTFPSDGLYRVEVIIDNKLIGSSPLNLARTEHLSEA